MDADAVVTATVAGDLHEAALALARSACASTKGPSPLFSDVAGRLEPVASDSIRRLEDVRELVLLNLLSIGQVEAAWHLAQDYAVGRVESPLTAGTSSGSPRADWPLPPRTMVEADRVFAWVPGFRDPRFDAPDEPFDITSLVHVRARLEELYLDGDETIFEGTAAWTWVEPVEADHVTLAICAGEVVYARPRAERFHRSDCATGGRRGLHRGDWAGWRVMVRNRDLAPAGRVTLSLEMGRESLVRRVPLRSAGGSMAAATHGAVVGTWLHPARIETRGEVSIRRLPPPYRRVTRHRPFDIFTRPRH